MGQAASKAMAAIWKNKDSQEAAENKEAGVQVAGNIPTAKSPTDHRKLSYDRLSFQTHLEEGNQALLDQQLENAEYHYARSLLKIQEENHNDVMSSATCIHGLGDVYMQYALQIKNSDCFIKASGLYNAAIRRYELVEDGGYFVQKIQQALNELEKQFFHALFRECISLQEPAADATKRHRNELLEIRDFVKGELQHIDKAHSNSYKYTTQFEDRFEVSSFTEAEQLRAEAVYKLSKETTAKMKEFVSNLIKESISVIGQPPLKCDWSFIGLGSLAREEVTPYSDLEFAILVEAGKNNEMNKSYFRNLTDYLHLKVLNIGETILPSLGIKCLNDFYSTDLSGDWFYDDLTPRGFCYDGAMPWASKTAKGRQPTKEKQWATELIKTPKEMARFQQTVFSLTEGYKIELVLASATLIYGSKKLLEDYRQEMKQIHKSDRYHKIHALETLEADLQKYSCSELYDIATQGKIMNVKKEIYRIPSTMIGSLSLYFQSKSHCIWTILEELCEKKILNSSNVHHLKVVWSIATEMRLQTYIANKGQREKISVLEKVNMGDPTDRNVSEVLHIQNQDLIFRFYYTVLPMQESLSTWIRYGCKQFPCDIWFDTSFCTQGLIYRRLLLFQQANSCFEKAKDKDTTNHLLHIYLGYTFHELGMEDKSCAAFIKALEVYENKSNTTSDTNRSRQELATLYHSVGTGMAYAKEDLLVAKQYMDKSMKIINIIDGDKPLLSTVKTLISSGFVYREAGLFGTAMELYEKAQRMIEQIPQTFVAKETLSIIYNNMGSLHAVMKNVHKGIEYHKKSLSLRYELFGDVAHPLIRANYQFLSAGYAQIGDMKQMFHYSEKFLSVQKQLAKKDRLGAVYSNMGYYYMKYYCDFKKALYYFEESMKHYTDGHYGTMDITLNNIAYAYKSLGLYDQALEYYESSAKESRTKDLSARIVHNIGCVFLKLKEFVKAASYFEESLKTRKQLFGEKCLEYVLTDSYLLLTNLYRKFQPEIDLVQKVVKAESSLRNSCDTVHPDSVQILNNCGCILIHLGHSNIATDLHNQALKISKELFTFDSAHLDTADCYFRLGCSLQGRGEINEAKTCFEEAHHMLKHILQDVNEHPDLIAVQEKLNEINETAGCASF